ncbi:hypothetical protein AM1165 [Anaplasma marginale str. St. Maries]|nr:hypothetical protein AM1165 [Anaplasma marginale str. St. Maries]
MEQVSQFSTANHKNSGAAALLLPVCYTVARIVAGNRRSFLGHAYLHSVFASLGRDIQNLNLRWLNPTPIFFTTTSALHEACI